MEGSISDLMQWRLEKAGRTLKDAEVAMRYHRYENCLNRCYYAVFYAMQAANCVYQFESRKHSGVISFFRQTFVKTGLIDKECSKIIESTSRYRERADYEDLFEATEEIAAEQLAAAKRFVEDVTLFLKSKPF